MLSHRSRCRFPDKESAVSKTPFADFLLKLEKDLGFSRRLYDQVAGTIELVAGINEKQASAFLSGDLEKVQAALDAEAGKRPHPKKRKRAAKGFEGGGAGSPRLRPAQKWPLEPWPYPGG
jgi:hypothetical protein